MGHRANYVVRKDGARTLYASNWGALSVLRDFFWGLAPALAFLDSEVAVDEDDGWYDDVFGEGGVAIDCDDKVIAISGGELYGPGRDLFIAMMRKVWAADGFTVDDVPSLVEVALQVGVPAEVVEADYLPSGTLDVSDDGHTGRGGWIGCVVLVDDEVRFCGTDRGILEAGPAIVDKLGALPDLAEAQRIHRDRDLSDWETERPPFGQALSELVTIDRERRELGMSGHMLRGGSGRYFAEQWNGWRLVEKDPFVVLRELALQGVTLAEDEPPPIEEQLKMIEEHLFEGESGSSWGVSVLQKAAERGDWVNPLGLHEPGDPLPDAARSLYEAARDAVLKERRAQRTR